MTTTCYPVALQQYVARDRAGVGSSYRFTGEMATTPRLGLMPYSDHPDLPNSTSMTEFNGFEPPNQHPTLSIRTNNLAPTPMFTSAFTTTPLSTYPPATPQDMSTRSVSMVIGGGTPRHSIDEMSSSLTSTSPHPASLNGTANQQSKLKRKLDRSFDASLEEDSGGQRPTQPRLARQTSGSKNPAKRVAPSPRNERNRSNKNE
jgi:hypothetical protein